jgi:hypothetical protein
VGHAEVVADGADDHLARVEPRAGREADPVLALPLGGVARQLVPQVERGEARPLGVVLVRDGRPEERHDAVARELVDEALEALDAARQDGEEALHDGAPGLGVELLGQLHRALHVGEQHGDLLALATEGVPRLEDLDGDVGRRLATRELRPRPQVNQHAALARCDPLHLDQLGNDLLELLAVASELAAEGAEREPPLLLEDLSGALQASDEAHHVGIRREEIAGAEAAPQATAV